MFHYINKVCIISNYISTYNTILTVNNKIKEVFIKYVLRLKCILWDKYTKIYISKSKLIGINYIVQDEIKSHIPKSVG